MRLANILKRSARFYPKANALICGSHRLTYKEFWERVNRLANGLASLGIGLGKRVAVLLSNCHRFAELYLAVPQLGAVLVPLNVRLSPRELIEQLEHSEAVALFSSEPFREKLFAMKSFFPKLKFLIGSGLKEQGFQDYEEFINNFPPQEIEIEFDDQEVAIQMYTSGTTGSPKGVLLTHGNLIANTLTGIFERRFTSRDIFLNTAPMFHIADVEYFLQIISVGGTNVFIDCFDPLLFLETVQRERVTATWIVPTMLHDLVAFKDLNKYDVTSLKTIYYGGACLSPELFWRAQKAFPVEFSLGFGLTEASPLISSLRPEDHKGDPLEVERRLRSCGRAVFNVDVCIMDEEGKKLSSGQIGEIAIRGANVMKGYWKMDQETQQVLRRGWLFTGDMGWMDEDGYIFLVDRKKDVIKSGGENIYSREVEEVILSHPAVKEVAVIGVPDERWGEAVKAFVVANDIVSCTEKDILDHCRKNLAGFKCPKSISFISTLPRNAMGKILKSQLRELYRKTKGDIHGL